MLGVSKEDADKLIFNCAFDSTVNDWTAGGKAIVRYDSSGRVDVDRNGQSWTPLCYQELSVIVGDEIVFSADYEVIDHACDLAIFPSDSDTHLVDYGHAYNSGNMEITHTVTTDDIVKLALNPSSSVSARGYYDNVVVTLNGITVSTNEESI